MDWNLIKLFLAVAESGSPSSAAKKLKVSDSTLFRQLTVLEEQTGRLFGRKKGSYELTELGEELLVLAKRASESVGDIERKVVGKDASREGTVRVTAPTSLSYGHFPLLVDQLRSEHPSIQIELLVTNDSLSLASTQADIAIRVTDRPPEHYVGRKILEVKWGVYAGHGYLAEYGSPTSTADFGNHRIIGASGGLSSIRAFKWLESAYPNSIGVKCDDLVGMSYLAEGNQGLALLPDELDRGGIKRLFTLDQGGVNSLWVLIHEDIRHVERVKLVMRHLVAKLAENVQHS